MAEPVEQSSSAPNLDQLFATVVEGGYCIGCGSCAVVAPDLINIRLDEAGRLKAVRRAESGLEESGNVLAVCPFSGVGPNEDEIGEKQFGNEASRHPEIGKHLSCYAGHVAEGQYRANGSSGGMGTWILKELIERSMVDAVLHVHETKRPSGSREPMFAFKISRSVREVQEGAKSRYYPVELSGVMQTVMAQPGRYAIVGVPCFIKATRLLALKVPAIRERLRFAVGLVCGHLKSARFADMFAWQVGVRPDELESISFRKKLSGQPANKYGVEIRGRRGDDGVVVVQQNAQFFGHLWGHGFFKYEACDFCDDVVGETADLTVGDAWLPQYLGDSDGTNILVVRNSEIQSIIEQGIAARKLALTAISADDVARSQKSGIYHRRAGLSYRLYLKDKQAAWRPPKRVRPGRSHLSLRYRGIFRLRSALSRRSHLAFGKALEHGEFDVFKEYMSGWLWCYELLYARKPLRYVCGAILRLVKRRLRLVAQRWSV